MTAREYQVRARLAREAFPPFRQGEVVVFCGDGISPIAGSAAIAGSELVVVTVKDALVARRRWLSVAAPDGSIHRGYGASLFRLADPDSCGALHHGQYAEHVPCGFECPRCRRPTPEALSRYWLAPARAARVEEER